MRWHPKSPVNLQSVVQLYNNEEHMVLKYEQIYKFFVFFKFIFTSTEKFFYEKIKKKICYQERNLKEYKKFMTLGKFIQ